MSNVRLERLESTQPKGHAVFGRTKWVRTSTLPPEFFAVKQRLEAIADGTPWPAPLSPSLPADGMSRTHLG